MNSSNKTMVPEAQDAMNRFKMEAANEVGVNLKQGYNGDLTSRQAGSVGGQMVKRSGAHSTDMQQPESTDDVFRRCRPYADQWTPSAERIWAEEHPGCTSCASCSGCASK